MKNDMELPESLQKPVERNSTNTQDVKSNENLPISTRSKSRKRTSAEVISNSLSNEIAYRKRPSYSASNNLGELLKEEGFRPLSPGKKDVKSGSSCSSRQLRSGLSRKSEPFRTFEWDTSYSHHISNRKSMKEIQFYEYLAPEVPFRKSLPSEENKIDYFSSLPDEMILKILRWLPKVSLAKCSSVSKRLHRLCFDDTLWKRVDGLAKSFTPSQITSVLNRKPVYLRLSQASFSGDVTEVASLSQLLYLDLSMALHLSGISLSNILKACTSLQKLSLEHLSISSSVLQAMMNSASSIEVLNLTMCDDFPILDFCRFLEQCSEFERMKELNLGCIKAAWTIEDVGKIVESLPKSLLRLNFSGRRGILNDDHVLKICKSCPSLMELDLSDGHELTSDSLKHICGRLLDLQHLALSRCYGISPPSYTLLMALPSLKYLELHSLFKENALRILQTSLPKIKINHYPFSTIARPTVGIKRSSIWFQRVRD